MYCVMYMQRNVHQKLLFACTYKREVVEPNKIQNGREIQNDDKVFAYQPAYNGRNAHAKCIYTERCG